MKEILKIKDNFFNLLSKKIEDIHKAINSIDKLLWNTLDTNIFLFLFIFSDDEEACDIAVTCLFIITKNKKKKKNVSIQSVP